MRLRRDAVVLGAGPAGALAALLLARAGRSVALLDRTAFPRPKVCGDCFNPRIEALLARHGVAEGFAALPHVALNAFELQTKGAPFHRAPILGDMFRAVDRTVFDAWLVGLAREAGAEFFDSTRIEAVHADGRVTTDQGEFSGTHLIAADGRNSFAARQAGLLRPSRDGRIGWQLRLAGIAATGTVRMNIFREGYYGLVSLPGGEANLAMVLDADARIEPEAILHRYLPEARITAARSIAPIARAPSPPVRESLWLVGDAARVVEPFTGEGIFFALASAELAAGLLAGNKIDAADLYRREHAALYRRHLGVNRLTRWLLGGGPARRRAAALLRHAPSVVRLLAGRVFRA